MIRRGMPLATAPVLPTTRNPARSNIDLVPTNAIVSRGAAEPVPHSVCRDLGRAAGVDVVVWLFRPERTRWSHSCVGTRATPPPEGRLRRRTANWLICPPIDGVRTAPGSSWLDNMSKNPRPISASLRMTHGRDLALA